MTELSDILPVELRSGSSSINRIAKIWVLFALLRHFYDVIDPEF